MLFQIIMVFLAIFIVYFGGHAAALYAYTSAFIGITVEYVDVQVKPRLIETARTLSIPSRIQ